MVRLMRAMKAQRVIAHCAFSLGVSVFRGQYMTWRDWSSVSSLNLALISAF
jgi:hypothetical protein